VTLNRSHQITPQDGMALLRCSLGSLRDYAQLRVASVMPEIAIERIFTGENALNVPEAGDA
jgi:hypothetical protein